jgi:outer membrane protein OmpA-like peptidoglycan-associated protein
VIDKIDQCPTLPGPKEQFGCPDSDGDHIYDNVDQCPNEPGLPELFGCPYADTDKDGIKDIEDKCPTQPGPVENGGCPYADSDGDGVIDLEDKCPKTPGVRENFGCPPITQEEKEVLKRAFDNLEFNTGKSTIRSTSFSSLNELADLLKSKPEYKLLIEGHTDNVGKRTSNITLSKNRSNAVMKYLVAKGVSSTRFIVKWYGPDKPIADNSTEEGRQRNRRVEMTLTAE